MGPLRNNIDHQKSLEALATTRVATFPNLYVTASNKKVVAVDYSHSGRWRPRIKPPDRARISFDIGELFM